MHTVQSSGLFYKNTFFGNCYCAVLIVGLVVLCGQKTFFNIRSYFGPRINTNPNTIGNFQNLICVKRSTVWVLLQNLKFDLLREGFWGVLSHFCFSSSQILSNLFAFLAASSGPPMSNKSVGTRPPC